jgi:hypothetical protein
MQQRLPEQMKKTIAWRAMYKQVVMAALVNPQMRPVWAFLVIA